MALAISGYVDPGVYIGEVISPTGITLATVPDILGVVAVGSRSKRSINEAVIRGQIANETLTLASSSPHTDTLTNRSNRRLSNVTIRRTIGVETVELPINAYFFLAAQLDGVAGPYDLNPTNAIGLKIDGGQEVTITLTSGASAVAITGSVIAVTTTLTTSGNAATAAEVAVGINAGLNAASALGYGPAFASVASANGSTIRLTSPTSGPASDVRVLATFVNDGAAALGFTTPARASSIIQVADIYYDSSATYVIDYVSDETLIDAFIHSPATKVIRVGSFAGVRSFSENTDYVLNSGNIDWSPDAAAVFTGSVNGTFDVSSNDMLRIALDGKAAVNIDLNAMASPPPGYTNPGTPASATAAEVANNINAVISATAGYGPRYRTVATVFSSTRVKLTSPTQGIASSIEVSNPASNGATTAILGLSTSQLPFTVIGTGSTPSTGVIYFATYEYVRPVSEYNAPKRFFSEDAMIQDLGPVSQFNRLSMLGQIAFDNDAPSIITVQVNDSSTPGLPTVNEVNLAIDGAEKSALITDVAVDDTRLNVQTKLMSHIENQSSVTEKHYRSGWFGMAAGTAIGDLDTPDSFCYRAGVTLQPSPDSPARGRLFLVVPASAQRVITNEDGSQVRLTLSSVAVGVAVAARHTSFTSPAISLAGKSIIGFDATTFPLFLKAQRAQLTVSGCTVVTGDSGVLQLLDPVSTERGGGNLTNFMFRSLSSQKDNVTRAVDQAIDRNLRGVVPEDLADFIFDIKVTVGSVLTSLISTGAIGPFRDANGVSRDIDLSKDVQAEQDKNDPTKFYFRYFFFLRYPALRFFGEFSTDNPFFVA